MKHLIKLYSTKLTVILFAVLLAVSGCENSAVDPEESDDEYVKNTAIRTSFSTNEDDDDNLLANEVIDFGSEDIVPDNENGGDTPIDTLVKWGRKVNSVSVTAAITFNSDTLKDVQVSRIISGEYRILGYVNGALDTIIKPYTQEQKRLATFKRIARTPQPRRNWRLYMHSIVDGNTTSPQTGKDNIVITAIEIYRNGSLAYTFTGPDFTQNTFTTKFFSGSGVPEVSRGDEVKVRVSLTSNQTDPDYAAYHWARNTFGFHRERFAMVSQQINGSRYDRVYEKTFNIYNQHKHGIFHAYISANTNASLYDDSPSIFSSTYAGIPYRVR